MKDNLKETADTDCTTNDLWQIRRGLISGINMLLTLKDDLSIDYDDDEFSQTNPLED